MAKNTRAAAVENVSKKSGTTTLRCGCTHAYQDRAYGGGVRVHNLCNSGAKARCTVCSGVKDLR